MDKIKNKHKTLIPKLISLLLSLGLWIYISNVENPMRTYEIRNIPVELVNLDSLKSSKFAISGNQNFTVDLKLEGPSTDITKVKREDFKIVADMSAYALKIGENTIPVQIISYPENITIKNNGFLGIKINLEELVTKKFTIQSKVKLYYKDNIYEMSKRVTPDTVTVEGANSSVGRISSAVIVGEENGISENFEKSYNIKLIDSNGSEVTGVTPDIDNARLSVEVSKGKSVPINLKTTGELNAGLELKGYELSSNYVNITGSGDALSKVQSIDTEVFDISKLEKTGEVNVKLNIPEGVNVPSGTDYIKVKFTIQEKENKPTQNETEKTVSKNLSLVVNYNNLKDGLLLESSSEKVNVTISAVQSELDKITDGSLNASVDLSSITDVGQYSYKPEVSFNSPTTATISNIDTVEVKINKKS